LKGTVAVMRDFENIMTMDSLYQSWQKISAKNSKAVGLDGVDLSFYRSDLRNNLRTLQASVLSGNYRPYTEKVYNHKNRTICISSVDDKIIQIVLAKEVTAAYTPAKSVHGFINKRSVFTAKKSLDNAIKSSIVEYSKVDIKRFYDSIDKNLLFKNITVMFSDKELLNLFELLIWTHGADEAGISTGSSLSPALSNLYLSDVDYSVEEQSAFYARYVDDMLVAPTTNISLVQEKLLEVGLEINREKSIEVNSEEGFRYLGFDIKSDIDTAIQKGNFDLAESLYEVQECDISASETSAPEVQPKPEYEIPNTIANVIKKCKIMKAIADKAKEESRLGFAEKTHLLQVFHCLGEAGSKFIHHILSYCTDYDYAETSRRINRYKVNNPLGCKKLRERFDDNSQCVCNFNNEKMYPTPIIHALRVDRKCFTPTTPKDNIGHFKAKNPKDKAVDAVSAMLELNRKQYEISEQQKIFKGQIEDLFERANTREFQTPQGLLMKSDDGIFIKLS
jgi:hypothetical protein